MFVSIKNLEKYIDEVHSHQIQDYEKLKKIATDAALGINAEALKPEYGPKGNAADDTRKVWIGENEAHTQCTRDFLTLATEQKRLDAIFGEITCLISDLIKVNLQREISPDMLSKGNTLMQSIESPLPHRSQF